MGDIEDIKGSIARIIIRDLELNASEDELRDEGRLDELFGLDSIAIIELVVGIEKEFSIRIPPEDLCVERFESLETIAGYIYSLILEKEKKMSQERGKQG